MGRQVFIITTHQADLHAQMPRPIGDVLFMRMGGLVGG